MSSIMENDADSAWAMLSDLVAVRDTTLNYCLEFLDSNERVLMSETIQAVTFSDTILLFTKSGSDTELRCMIVLVAEMLHKAIHRCVPVRAGLSFGKFYFNFEKSMYAGPALIEAYRIGESAQWLGIALAESIQERAINLKMMSSSSKVIVRWALPLKDGTKPCFVVNWPAVVAHDLTVTPPISVEQFYLAFESTFGTFARLPLEVRAKYENTVKFLNEQLIRHHDAESLSQPEK